MSSETVREAARARRRSRSAAVDRAVEQEGRRSPVEAQVGGEDRGHTARRRGYAESWPWMPRFRRCRSGDRSGDRPRTRQAAARDVGAILLGRVGGLSHLRIVKMAFSGQAAANASAHAAPFLRLHAGSKAITCHCLRLSRPPRFPSRCSRYPHCGPRLRGPTALISISSHGVAYASFLSFPVLELARAPPKQGSELLHRLRGEPCLQQLLR